MVRVKIYIVMKVVKPVTDDSLALSSVNAWANEGFGAGANPNADETGHYSAMNWRSATKLGCGIGRDSGTGWAVVTCNYADTPSNYIPQSVGNLITSDPSLSEYVTTTVDGNTTNVSIDGYG